MLANALLLIGCQSYAIKGNGNDWLTAAGAPLDAREFRELRSDEYFVAPISRRQAAIEHLQNLSVVAVSQSEARTFGANVPIDDGSHQWFLIRSVQFDVGRAKLWVRVSQDEDVVWTDSGILTHRAVSLARAPVLLSLQRAPSTIVVTASAAE
jgi:hypothetical protein